MRRRTATGRREGRYHQGSIKPCASLSETGDSRIRSECGSRPFERLFFASRELLDYSGSGQSRLYRELVTQPGHHCDEFARRQWLLEIMRVSISWTRWVRPIGSLLSSSSSGERIFVGPRGISKDRKIEREKEEGARERCFISPDGTPRNTFALRRDVLHTLLFIIRSIFRG